MTENQQISLGILFGLVGGVVASFLFAPVGVWSAIIAGILGYTGSHLITHMLISCCCVVGDDGYESVPLEEQSSKSENNEFSGDISPSQGTSFLNANHRSGFSSKDQSKGVTESYPLSFPDSQEDTENNSFSPN